MHRIIPIAIAILLAAPATASAATSPQRAARTTASCLRAQHWTVTVHGRVVHARSPRQRPANSFPRRPRYTVTFNDLGVSPIEIRQGLNRAENNLTIRCRNRGLRA